MGNGKNFTALIDTGSGNLVVASSNCISNGCKGHRRFRPEDDDTGRLAANASGELQLSYAGAQLAGNGFESRVCLGGACGRASFVLAAWESVAFRDLSFDAILGLGPLHQAVSPNFSVLRTLTAQAALPSASFTLSLRSDGASTATFGSLAMPPAGHGADEAEPPTWLAVDKKHGEWAVHLEDVLVDGKRTVACPHAGCRAILDTGCPDLVLPAAALDSVRAHLPLDDCSPGSIAALPSLRLAWGEGGHQHEVRPQHYVDVSDDDPPRCRLLLSAADSFGTRTAVLGLPFFLGRDVAFDQDLMRVGISDTAPRQDGQAVTGGRKAAARGASRERTALGSFLGG